MITSTLIFILIFACTIFISSQSDKNVETRNSLGKCTICNNYLDGERNELTQYKIICNSCYKHELHKQTPNYLKKQLRWYIFLCVCGIIYLVFIVLPFTLGNETLGFRGIEYALGCIVFFIGYPLKKSIKIYKEIKIQI